jgi:hypothetical protein
MNEPRKPNNLKTALVLAGIAAFFFAAVILQHVL